MTSKIWKGIPKVFKEICGNCGRDFGHHSGKGYYSEHHKMHVPLDYCPGPEGRMQWNKGPGTTFKSTGNYQK